MRILMIEDDRWPGFTLEPVLHQARYTLDRARDVQEAFDYSRTTRYDAIVVSGRPPRLNAVEVCRHLRATGLHTPLLLLTGRTFVDELIQGLDVGADDGLTIPYREAELLARLRALLRRNSPHRQGSLQLGDLVLDPSNQQVVQAGRPITLTRREYCLLETLLRRANGIVSRSRLIDSVWGFDYPDESNLLEVYIGRLRRKLTGSSSPMIETARGAGYRLRA